MAGLWECAPTLWEYALRKCHAAFLGSGSASMPPDRERRFRVSVSMLAAFAVWSLLFAGPAQAVTPESPEVRKLIADGLAFLEKETDHRLGGKCLVALAFIKDGASPDHPRIQEALEACKATPAQAIRSESVYSNGLAIIFLVELNPKANRELISRFAGAMLQRQKPHGGWGYEPYRTGDTSQTQYAALSFWELMQIGMTPSVESVDRCTNWLLRTQDPSGKWGYQGNDPGEMKRVKQDGRNSLSMLAAGLGSTMICGNILGLLKPGQVRQELQSVSQEKLPPALRLANEKAKRKMLTLSGSQVDPIRLRESITLAQQWMDNHFQPRVHEYNSYYLYSLERYKSFEELLTGNVPEEPDWYQKGYELLKKTQKEHGGWHSQSDAPCATAFAVLFLLRSTQKSIRASLGQGTLVGGRGLSANLAQMKLRRGKLVVEQKPTEVDKLLGMLEETGSADLDALLSNPAAISVGKAGPDEARRLEQILRSGPPEARQLAVRALAGIRSLDYVPSLLYAMTDPDKRVVREARDGLRFVSRRFGGFGLKDNFTDRERYDALEKWKQWYHMIRPDAL